MSRCDSPHLGQAGLWEKHQFDIMIFISLRSQLYLTRRLALPLGTCLMRSSLQEVILPHP